MAEEEVMLTTTDNPYNPFDNFEVWYAYDMMLARQQERPTVCSLIARIGRFSTQMTDVMEQKAYQMAIDEILEYNVTGKYKKVTESEAKSLL